MVTRLKLEGTQPKRLKKPSRVHKSPWLGLYQHGKDSRIADWIHSTNTIKSPLTARDYLPSANLFYTAHSQ